CGFHSMGPRSDNRGYDHAQTFTTTPSKMLQWVRGPITAVMGVIAEGLRGGRLASMGPRSDNRGYGNRCRLAGDDQQASMGPRSDNRGYGHEGGPSPALVAASMGPRSDNRGYAQIRLP